MEGSVRLGRNIEKALKSMKYPLSLSQLKNSGVAHRLQEAGILRRVGAVVALADRQKKFETLLRDVASGAAKVLARDLRLMPLRHLIYSVNRELGRQPQDLTKLIEGCIFELVASHDIRRLITLSRKLTQYPMYFWTTYFDDFKSWICTCRTELLRRKSLSTALVVQLRPEGLSSPNTYSCAEAILGHLLATGWATLTTWKEGTPFTVVSTPHADN